VRRRGLDRASAYVVLAFGGLLGLALLLVYLATHG
jgi:hypothetical protein